MATMRVLAMVLAGGTGTRLHPLTAENAKPALPLAGGCRIVDFVLSNLFNSGIVSVYVLAQHKPSSLLEHIGCAWGPAVCGPDRFVRVVLPDPGRIREGFLGTADAVYRNLSLVNRHRPDLVAVFAADQVYRMDVAQMVEFHTRSRATLTVAAVPVPVNKASSFGVIVTARDGRVKEFQEKPQTPAPIPTYPTHAYASMGNYLFEPCVLVELLTEAHGRGETDFGRHILPRASRSHRVFAYDFRSNRVPGLRACEEPHYWRDVGTLAAYRGAQADVSGSEPRFNLANACWPVRPDPPNRATACLRGSMASAERWHPVGTVCAPRGPRPGRPC